MTGKRERLVMRLVERKMASGTRDKVFCICAACMAGSPKNQTSGILAASRSKSPTN